MKTKIMWHDKIRQRMKERHVANKTLAAHLGVLDSTISHWLSGRNEPSYAALVTIAEFLDVSLDWLLMDVPVMRPAVNVDDAILEAQGF